VLETFITERKNESVEIIYSLRELFDMLASVPQLTIMQKSSDTQKNSIFASPLSSPPSSTKHLLRALPAASYLASFISISRSSPLFIRINNQL
jgi:hypothetical protein